VENGERYDIIIKGMKINKLLSCVTVLLALFIFTLPVAALSESANITDLMGQRPSNTYYQNTGSGTQTQGSSSVTGSAGSSVLRQEPTSKLSVDAPAITITPTISEQKSSSWKLFAVLAVIFLIAAAVLFVTGMKRQKRALEAVLAAEPEEIEEVVEQPVKRPKAKKSQTKKKIGKHRPVNRHKKKR
jgi:hypothetical protein